MAENGHGNGRSGTEDGQGERREGVETRLRGPDATATAGTETVDRRTVLGALAGAGAASLAGCMLLEPDEDAPTERVSGEDARDLAEGFAPTLYFDEAERWFPTDPRPYASERDGETVVEGFDAVDGYTARLTDADGPPDPTVFYHVLEYADSPLAVVQYWLYSAFDQFTTNFHWHDWEVLHVFVDTETDEPQLYVASAHSRSVPNNEFLDPETAPAILSELGSHSSALSVNEERDRFQRFPIGDAIADITNSAIEGIEDLAEFPVAYGLPRDEGGRLPYLVPELDGAPVYDHERLPSVGPSDLIDGSLVVRSFDALASPPTDLPERETGLVFGPGDGGGDDPDVVYDLVPTAELEHIEGFTGPQLSFEFAVPAFAEDAVASHITTTGTPWKDPRYEDPARDVSDPNHRAALADRYDAIGDPAPANAVVALVTNAVANGDAPDGEGLTTEESTVEAVAYLESEGRAVPTFGGVAAVQDVPAGEHRLTVNGAGLAPHAEPLSVADEGSTAAGVDGEIPLVAREAATKLEVDAEGAESTLTGMAVADDFAGRLYDAPLAGPDAVYVHRGGAYTTEVRDAEGAIGAFRVNPGEADEGVRIDEPRTGKASLASYVGTLAEETRADGGQSNGSGTDDGGQSNGGPENAIRGLQRALAAVAEAAGRAADRAKAGERGRADQSLAAVETGLERIAERLTEARGDLPADLSRAIDRRLEQADRRTEQARAAEKL